MNKNYAIVAGLGKALAMNKGVTYHKRTQRLCLPPSDEGGGICGANDGGRENRRTMKIRYLSLSPRICSDSSLVRGSQGSLYVWVASNPCMLAGQYKAHSCAAGSIRAMPENEISPAMRALFLSEKLKSLLILVKNQHRICAYKCNWAVA